MNKKDLIKSVSEQADFTLANAEKAINAITNNITNELAGGGNVSLIGFGVFQVKERAERNGRNPQTGDTIKIAAAKIPSFKAGKALKDTVNSK
ncbi:MAG: DNA-binding protein HU [Rheinheimera sp.]|uniref:HU family DNA-binding protein n=1 Tax=Pseudoalteromonas agarivorans TaxID=176102 RepID=A0AAD0U836_9GAMM|nr:HU family DNA-binding protein [Pseudoalteromonas agarivorans]AYM89009.1 HU family DNA-binding protein [Pseudoalteromonas agarivorans]MAD75029.1 DNA-binding protein HU [Rheinheimera sp.]|tara:strand:+ start:13192 stop:13470 length:279 start_codon:yes stop_codon:yes gene_type:complete